MLPTSTSGVATSNTETCVISSTPLAQLRWVKRGGERVLQQRYQVVKRYASTGGLAGSSAEWCDVPTDEVE